MKTTTIRVLLAVLLALTMTEVALAAGQERYVVLVSMDGFRYDYTRIYDTPFLDSLGQAGVSAQMRPSFPSKTFPNHYTLCTGLVPDHHGLVHNTFIDPVSGRLFSLGSLDAKYDGTFYGGEPLWLTAQRQGINAGVVYWPGSDVEILGQRPFSYKRYDDEVHLTFDERIAEVRRLLTLPAADNVRLVLCYFEQPDEAGHHYGPYDAVTRSQTMHIDTVMHRLYDMISALPIAAQTDVILLSDHGMTELSPDRYVAIADYLKPEWYKDAVWSIPSTLNVAASSDPTVNYADSILSALSEAPHVRAWRKEDVPACYQYGSNPRVADIVILPDMGWTVGPAPSRRRGDHGYDPFSADMLVPFWAIGPDFRQHYRKPDQFQNISVYPLVCHLLGIEPAPCDGRLADVSDLLAE